MMTGTFRALCAELTDKLHGYASANPHHDSDALVARARAALADEPPEPIPPAALPEGYIDPEHSGDDRALLQTFYSACQAEGGTADEVTLQGLRAVLARWGNPAPLPPADGEVAELAAWLQEEADDYECIGCEDSAAKCNRAAELLQRQALVPVSVSERPWEREGWCDVEGRFWAEHISRSGVASWRCAAASDLGGWAVRCLPAHALPLPEVGE